MTATTIKDIRKNVNAYLDSLGNDAPASAMDWTDLRTSAETGDVVQQQIDARNKQRDEIKNALEALG